MFVIYYGWLIADVAGTPNSAAHAIAAARPDLLIASFNTFEPKYINLSRQVRDLLHQAGVRLFAYVDTGYGQRDRNVVKAEALEYLSQDVDGIFFDQVYNFLDNAQLEYYQELYGFVRNQLRSVIVNPGIGQPGQEIMNVTDILMVEHAWREMYQANSWFSAYPPQRFMGNSSDEHNSTYLMDCEAAVKETTEAWNNGIGWHFSTNRYTALPVWFLDYAFSLGQNQ